MYLNSFFLVLVNIPCNWLLIFYFDMGIAGAAIASSFAELCSLIILSIHVLRKMDRMVYGLNWQFNKNIFHHVCRVSIWSMFNPFIGVASWFAFFVAMSIWASWNWQRQMSYAAYPPCFSSLSIHWQQLPVHW